MSIQLLIPRGMGKAKNPQENRTDEARNLANETVS
jgi:hypothetical protein